MSIALLSINHQKASVDIRQQVVFANDKLGDYLKALKKQNDINGCVILSTCHRSEIYVHSRAQSSEKIKKQLTTWLSKTHQLNFDLLSPHSCFFEKSQATYHLASVASGLESAVLGEPQILGQLKYAYQQAKENNCLDKVLEKLFQHTFAVAKRVRSQTDIGTSPVSIAYCAVKLAQQIFSALSEQKALLIGSGDMIKLAAQHLNQHKIAKITIANRTLEKANEIANLYPQGQAITLTGLSDSLTNADIIITSTASPVPIIGKGAIESALKKRKHKPMLIIDLAMPRDVEVQVSQLSDAYFYSIDDLAEITQQNQQNRAQAKTQGQTIISHANQKFMQWFHSLPNDTLIQIYRQQAKHIKEQTLKDILKKNKYNAETQTLLRLFADQLTNKLTHQPSQTLKNNPWQTEKKFKAIAKSLLIQDNND